MSLPIRTTAADVEVVCGYLATKPTGATIAEAKAVLESKVVEARKLTALKTLGFIEDNGDKMRVTERGRDIARDKGARRAQAFLEAVSTVRAYSAVIERAVHRKEFTVAATDVGAHWHEHFKEDVSDNDRVLNEQAICFFQFAEGADLGELVVGRRGQPTRFEFDEANARKLVEGGGTGESEVDESNFGETENSDTIAETDSPVAAVNTPDTGSKRGNRVFITHGKNKKILSQVKELVAYGKFEPIVAQEHETSAKPVPEKVMDDMRGCQAAVIHVGVDGLLQDGEGNPVPQINQNVLIEIGAAMALYGRNFILLVEEGVDLPSNLQGLYECRYSGDELNMPATMKLLKAFNDFK